MTFPLDPITNESMRTYLMTWLVMHGTKFIDLDATCEVDDAIEDALCWHWDSALERGYVYNIGYARSGETSEMSRLTKKALAFIKESK